MTILVLNANGKVGAEVANQLIAKGEKVRIGARDTVKAKASHPRAEVVAVDFGKPDTIKAAVQGVDAIFSATPYELLPQPELDLVAAAKSAGVKHIVKISTQGADEDATTPHGAVEKSIRDSGLTYTILRPNFFMQNYAVQQASSIRTRGAFYEPADEGKSSFVDTHDIAAVAVKVLTEKGHGGKSYVLTGGEALNSHEVAAANSEAISKPVKFVNVDDAGLRKAMTDAPPKLTELMSVLMGYVRANYTGAVSPDIERLLGRKPIAFAQFAKDHASVWRN
jgi:uncharacterized protein YbjT (DUF2867 family)